MKKIILLCASVSAAFAMTPHDVDVTHTAPVVKKRKLTANAIIGEAKTASLPVVDTDFTVANSGASSSSGLVLHFGASSVGSESKSKSKIRSTHTTEQPRKTKAGRVSSRAVVFDPSSNITSTSSAQIASRSSRASIAHQPSALLSSAQISRHNAITPIDHCAYNEEDDDDMFNLIAHNPVSSSSSHADQSQAVSSRMASSASATGVKPVTQMSIEEIDAAISALPYEKNWMNLMTITMNGERISSGILLLIQENEKLYNELELVKKRTNSEMQFLEELVENIEKLKQKHRACKAETLKAHALLDKIW